MVFLYSSPGQSDRKGTTLPSGCASQSDKDGCLVHTSRIGTFEAARGTLVMRRHVTASGLNQPFICTLCILYLDQQIPLICGKPVQVRRSGPAAQVNLGQQLFHYARADVAFAPEAVRIISQICRQNSTAAVGGHGHWSQPRA